MENQSCQESVICELLMNCVLRNVNILRKATLIWSDVKFEMRFGFLLVLKFIFVRIELKGLL